MSKFQILDDGVQINKISKTFEKKTIVRDISLNIQKGEILTKEKLLTKRPATGIEPKHLDQILGKKLNRSIKQDTAIVWEDIE